MTGALLATLWFVGLWYAAPILDRNSNDLCDRLRNMMVLGVAIPMALGLVGLLYPWACVAALAACAWLRFQSGGSAMEVVDRVTAAVLCLTLVLIWPYLCEPLLDGDSLLYHLPNAAAWAQNHSVWLGTTHEWFYPPASELFASPLFALGARYALPLCGAVPALLLTARITTWAAQYGLPRYVGGVCALALLATPIVAFETGTLQNDLWLSAFFLEALYFAQTKTDWKSLAMCALTKPSGFLFAVIAILSARRLQLIALLSFVPLAIWIARDVLVAGHSKVGAQAIAGGYWASTIAANLPHLSTALISGLHVAGFSCVLFLCLPIVGLFLRAVRRIAAAGCAALIVFAFLPMSFGAASSAFLNAGTSLRFAIPAMSAGTIVLLYLASKARTAVSILAGGIALTGVVQVSLVFASDGVALNGIWIALLLASAACTDRTRLQMITKLAIVVVLITGSWLASQRAPAFYANWMRALDGTPTKAFAWIADHRPARIVAADFRTGTILMASPATRVLDVDDRAACKAAHDTGALLFAGTDRDVSEIEQQRRFTLVRSCGTVIFQDKAALIVNPR
ncbi:MAG: hypothetical protein M3N19_04875 [Candidatus Eremiobacteraeota bacterium]|nr:hypothetical protein [Candidatus Eremiobacteraeota bacterium]